MALQKDYTNNQGITVNYWCITNIAKNLRYKTAEITICGYLTLQAKEQGFEPVETRRVKVLWDDFESYFSTEVLNSTTNDIEQAYTYIKEHVEMFAEAIDV